MNHNESKKKYDDIHLTDNNLFISVLKNKKACQIVLSIIFQKDIEDIQLETVEVEKVVLNEVGRRAIRLDVCATEKDDGKNTTIYDLEMQVEEKDHLPKRSRFYQSLMDAPILKSGKETKYRNLPNTYIIFITEDDIFGKDRACYTFQNYCKELKDLELGDGAVKIFLNMESKNGDTSLVEMLQYMKDSKLAENQRQAVDYKIKILDEIVEEVKESKEWEATNMTIFKKGKEIGSEERLMNQVLSNYKKGYPNENIAEYLDITEQEVEAMIAVIKQYPNATAEELVENHKNGIR